VITIDPVEGLAVLHEMRPEERLPVAQLPLKDLSAMSVDAGRAISRCTCDAQQVLPQGSRWSRARLLDIDLPEQISRVRQIDANARELEMLFLLHSKAKPVTRYEQAAIAIDVEPLVSVPPSRARGDAVLIGTDPTVMRQDKRLDFCLLALTG
jgi:hypothetical protein